MPKYVIERELPGAGRMDPATLQEVSARSNAVLSQIGEGLQWVHSYVTADHLFCVYNAESEEKIREHARVGGFPCTRVHQVAAVIDPVTGE